MEIASRELSDGRIEVVFTGTPEELREEFGPVGDEDEAADEDADEEESSLMARKKYCCACGNGERKTIKASSGFSAAAKCLERCKGPFSVGHGAC